MADSNLISKIKLTSGVECDINAKYINGHTVNTDVPSDAKFTDTNIDRTSITVGSTNVTGTNTTGVTLVAGNNVRLTPDSTNGKITIATDDSGAITSLSVTEDGGLKAKIVGYTYEDVIGFGSIGSTNNTWKNPITYAALDAGHILSGEVVTIPSATSSIDGYMPKEYVSKLNDIESGAEINQNSFSNIIVGSTPIVANSKTDNFTLIAGNNISLSPDVNNNSVTINAAATPYTHPATHPWSILTGVPTGASSVPGITTLVSGDLNGKAYADGKAASQAHTHSQYLTSHQDISGKENSSNKVSSWSSTTTDAHYPSEKLVKTSLDAKLNTSLKGAANGLAELDANGKVPASQLPSYVDDVLEYTNSSSFPSTGEAGKIYIAQDTNKTYRWSGSGYSVISETISIGETSSTAYAGDKGKALADKLAGIDSGANKYTHPSYTAKSSGLYKITVDGTGHVSAATAVAKADITALGIPGSDTVYTHPTDDGNLHVPATGTSNGGKVLTAGSTAGSLSWTSLPTSLPANGGNADKIDGYHISVVTSMPTNPDVNTIYIIK